MADLSTPHKRTEFNIYEAFDAFKGWQLADWRVDYDEATRQWWVVSASTGEQWRVVLNAKGKGSVYGFRFEPMQTGGK